MNSLAEHKNRIVRHILDITDENILRDIETILGDESIITTSGKKLSEKEYIESISNAIKNGAKTYTSQEVRASILNRKQ